MQVWFGEGPPDVSVFEELQRFPRSASTRYVTRNPPILGGLALVWLTLLGERFDLMHSGRHIEAAPRQLAAGPF
jgi:hypothetical protein